MTSRKLYQFKYDPSIILVLDDRRKDWGSCHWIAITDPNDGGTLVLGSTSPFKIRHLQNLSYTHHGHGEILFGDPPRRLIVMEDLIEIDPVGLYCFKCLVAQIDPSVNPFYCQDCHD